MKAEVHELRPAFPATDRAARSTRAFRDGLLFMAAVGVGLLVWRLAQLILILFACGIVAMMVDRLAGILRRRLGLPFWLAFTLAVVLPVGFVAAAFVLFGTAMAAQFEILWRSLPEALRTAESFLMGSEAGRRVLAEVPTLVPSGQRILAFAQGLLADVGSVVSIVAVILVGGIYIAAQPALYRRSILALVPPARRLAVSRTFRRVVQALRAWLKAQLVGMAFVGAATGLGLSLVGIPGAPAIGLVAGLCEFVPYLGTFVVAIPSILIGLSIGIDTGLLTIAVIVGVQQIQGNLVSPMAQSRLADLPPALTIFSLVAFGLLMGPLGVILAVPLTVVGVALLRELALARRAG